MQTQCRPWRAVRRRRAWWSRSKRRRQRACRRDRDRRQRSAAQRRWQARYGGTWTKAMCKRRPWWCSSSVASICAALARKRACAGSRPMPSCFSSSACGQFLSSWSRCAASPRSATSTPRRRRFRRRARRSVLCCRAHIAAARSRASPPVLARPVRGRSSVQQVPHQHVDVRAVQAARQGPLRVVPRLRSRRVSPVACALCDTDATRVRHAREMFSFFKSNRKCAACGHLCMLTVRGGKPGAAAKSQRASPIAATSRERLVGTTTM